MYRWKNQVVRGIKTALACAPAICILISAGGKALASGKRDPFIPLVTSDGRLIQPAVPYGEDDVRLEGFIYDQTGSSLAIINGAVAGVGDSVRGFRVIKIEADKVTLMKDGELKEMLLQKKKEGSFGQDKGR